jgi:tetratricopeptide (TPR) repeat protein
MFARWLRRLCEAAVPGGIIVFTLPAAAESFDACYRHIRSLEDVRLSEFQAGLGSEEGDFYVLAKLPRRAAAEPRPEEARQPKEPVARIPLALDKETSQYTPSEQSVFESVRAHAGYKYAYLNNAKAACSTIKATLWRHSFVDKEIDHLPSVAELHGGGIWGREFRELSPENYFIFSFVRNPYLRALSCYLNKIASNNSKNATRPLFCARYGFALDADITFLDFLRSIQTTSSPEDDQHWRLQRDNIFYGIVPIQFIGNLEHFDDDLSFVAKALGVSLKAESSLADRTGAELYILRWYGDEAIELVQRKYAQDFQTFGYGFELSQLGPVERRKGSGSTVWDIESFEYVNLLGIADRRPQAAAGALEKLRQHRIRNPYVYQTYFNTLLRLGKRRQARVIVEEAAQRFPGHEASLTIQVDQAMRGRRLDSAAEPALELTRRRPELHSSWQRLARVAIGRGQAELAVQAAERAVLLYDRIENFIGLGEAYLCAGDGASALQAFDRALSMNPHFSPALRGRARAVAVAKARMNR